MANENEKTSMVAADDKENNVSNMTGRQKAAALLIALGSDACAKVFKSLDEDEVQILASDIASMQNVSSSAMRTIMKEFSGLLSSGTLGIQGGMAYATEALTKALGAEGTADTVERIQAGTRPFGLLTSSPSATELLLEMIREEHPQTIALILVHINEARSAEILGSLSPELRTEVVSRIANMTAVSPEIISHVEDALQMKAQGLERVMAGGVRTAAEILNRAEADVEKQVMDSIAELDSALAEEISDHMFTYDDIVKIADAGVQKILQQVDENDLLMALKASTDDIKTKILRNMSERKRQTIQEDMEKLPPLRLKDVLAAQKRILSVAKEMAQSGRVEIVRDGEGEVFVQ